MEKQKVEKVSFRNSLKARVLAMLTVDIFIVVALIIIIAVPRLQKIIRNQMENYLVDLAESSGESLEFAIKQAGSADTVYSDKDLLGELFSNVSMKGMDSSYAYLVEADGTMLYHKEAEKIGKPVENDAVKYIVSELEKGQTVKPCAISYKYNGDDKCAGCYVTAAQDAIVVVTVDEAQVFASLNQLIRTVVCGAVILLVLMTIIGYFVTCKLVDPILKIKDSMSQIAGLVLNDKVDPAICKRKDEVGIMGRAVESMQKRLVETVSSISEQSTRVQSSSEELVSHVSNLSESAGQVDNAVEEIARGATDQASDTQSATESVYTIGKMVDETGRQAKILQNYAGEMSDSTNKAFEALSELTDVNAKTKEYIGAISKQTDTTNESAQKIREAITIITSIADETSLLSLNASIEAARAGEQGKGLLLLPCRFRTLQNSRQLLQLPLRRLPVR